MADSGFSVSVKVFNHFRMLSVFRHIQAYSGVNGHIQKCFWNFHNPLQPWHLQNFGVFRTRAYSRLSQTSTMECFAKIVKDCNYFRNIGFSRFLLYEIHIMSFLKTGLIFTPEIFVLCKKVWHLTGRRAMDFDIPFTITAFH